MLIFTDAGYKKGVSSHGFIVKHWNGVVIKEHSHIGTEDDSIKSEIASIVSALNWINSRKKLPRRQIRIYTDCLPIFEAVNGINNHSFDVTYIKHQLRRMNAKLLWRKRKFVADAHELAHNRMVNCLKRDELKNTYKNKAGVN